ncbi:unnamed protein product [Tuber melanosporum]|uniref:(Perigord truffle) hypothetical protein n=1 Tax=Tuber melanosporum (strain Mel28) TaxID=656061 RepID=D5GIZ6_TUBMM|nr:uncharacterized protein GSTUM_00008754001 [Tuber melanosporum]CAZ84489.1 unnamed protein product [Tuber melanosporum]
MWISRSSPTVSTQECLAEAHWSGRPTDRARGDEDGAGASAAMHHVHGYAIFGMPQQGLERPRDFRFPAAVLSPVVFPRGSALCNVWVEYHQYRTVRYRFCSITGCDGQGCSQGHPGSEQPQLPEDCGTQ